MPSDLHSFPCVIGVCVSIFRGLRYSRVVQYGQNFSRCFLRQRFCCFLTSGHPSFCMRLPARYLGTSPLQPGRRSPLSSPPSTVGASSKPQTSRSWLTKHRRAWLMLVACVLIFTTTAVHYSTLPVCNAALPSLLFPCRLMTEILFLNVLLSLPTDDRDIILKCSFILAD
jgi:hypothetical protein